MASEAGADALLVAHGYGNRRHLVARAIEAGADMIEADLRYESGAIWIRHERRLGILPVLYNRRLSPAHQHGPFGFNAGPWYVRPDIRRMTLGNLLTAVAGRAGLLLDLKAVRYTDEAARRFAQEVVSGLTGASFAARVEFCGGWPMLDVMRAVSPGAAVRYSVDSPQQWEAAQPRLLSGDITAISIHSALLDEGAARPLRDGGTDFYCWAVTGAADAERAIRLGASGIIAPLEVLSALRAARNGSAVR